MSWTDDVQHFIEVSKTVSSARDLERLVSDITREMGFDYFALIHHVDLSAMEASLSHMADGSLVALTNYPEAWVEAYVARNIVANDPVLLASERTSAGFRWDEMGDYIDVTSEHRRVTDDTRKAGLVAGYTVPANVPGETNGSCTFAVKAGRELPSGNLPMAQVVGAFAFQAARSLILRARKPEMVEERRPLTPRQVECLLLVARGKSDWEIAQILGISEETVKRHIAVARERYDVSKRVQVVLRALYEGKLAISDLVQ